MTRMWGINPKLLCRKHLLGEHNELHKFVGSLKKGKNIDGFLKGLVFVANIVDRHYVLAFEMIKRGYKHTSPLDEIPEFLPSAPVDVAHNLKELSMRCQECKERIEKVVMVE